MLPTVGQVLEMDAVRAGEPRVVAGERWLGQPVRWVHAVEVPDAGRLLRGGGVGVAAGVAVADEEGRLADCVAGLAGVGVSGLAIELGRKYTGGVPEGFVAAAEEWGVPLIVFEREVAFVGITEAVHARIIDEQLAE